jgi:hypothetical protein
MLEGTGGFHWHVDDLTLATSQPDVKKKIKPVLFDEEQIIKGEHI